MKIFITGASGFVGSHLVEELVKKEKVPSNDISALVRRSSGISLLKRLNVNLVFGDLERQGSWGSKVSQADLIFHLGAQAHLGEPETSYTVNVLGMRNIISALSRNRRHPRIIFLSSICAVDRSPDDDCQSPVDEDYLPCPQTVYGQTKLEAERLLIRGGRKKEFDYVILRAPLIFGPRSRPNSAVSSFIRGIKKQSLVYSCNFPGGFSLIYVKDLVRALIFVGESPRAIKQAFFVANPEPVKVSVLFDKIASSLRIKRTVLPLPLWVFSLVYTILKTVSSTPVVSRFIPRYSLNIFKPYWVCSSNRLATTVGFKPVYDLDEALEQTVGCQLSEDED